MLLQNEEIQISPAQCPEQDLMKRQDYLALKIVWNIYIDVKFLTDKYATVKEN